jgi:pyruvate ferredoxin oxidoreductase delta subunit
MTRTGKGWRDVAPGAIVDEAGNSREYLTGDWRSMRPVWDKDKCINCYFCWVYCPDSAVRVVDGKVQGIDYRYCKGCGICAAECPKRVQALTMVNEAEALAAEAAVAAAKQEGGCC